VSAVRFSVRRFKQLLLEIQHFDQRNLNYWHLLLDYQFENQRSLRIEHLSHYLLGTDKFE
jgi:hypothetical protein